MALPKFKKDINLVYKEPSSGPKDYVNNFLEENPNYLPRSVDQDDLDMGFVEFVTNDLEVIIKGEKIPVYFLTLQRWTEFQRTWPNNDTFKNIKIPFISVVKKPDVQKGTNPSDAKIPVRLPFGYMKVPTWDGNRKGMDIYEIPNPVGIDITYNVRFFSYKMKELNKLSQKVLQTFASTQAYIKVKGHHFPVLLENIGDESTVSDLENRRYYVQTFEMKLQGYLVDPEEFKVKPAISRSTVLTEICTDKPIQPVVTKSTDSNPNDLLATYNFKFLPRSSTSITLNTEEKTVFSSVKTENITAYYILVNNVQVQTPFTINPYDDLTITIFRQDSNLESELIIKGTIDR